MTTDNRRQFLIFESKRAAPSDEQIVHQAKEGERDDLSLCLSLGVGDLTVATDIDMNRRLIDRATNNVQRAGSASAWGFLCHTLTAVSRLTRRPICCFHLCAPFHRHFNVEEDARAQLFAVVVVVIFPPPDLMLLLLLLRRLREH